MLIVYFALAFASGIVISALFEFPSLVWTWWIVLPIGLLIIWRRDARLIRASHPPVFSSWRDTLRVRASHV